MAVGQKSVVADALKSVGEDVNQKAADELVGGKRHRLLAIAVTVILPLEADLTAVEIKQAVIGYGDTVSVAADVIEYLLGTAEWRFGVDAPFRVLDRPKIAGKFVGIGQSLKGGGEAQLAGIEGLTQVLEKQPAE